MIYDHGIKEKKVVSNIDNDKHGIKLNKSGQKDLKLKKQRLD